MAIKKQLCFDKPFAPTALLLLADAVLFVVAFYLLTLPSTAAFIASQMMLALFFFHNFGILHEAVHGNLHKKRWVNNAVGHYASIFCFTAYFPWRYMHQKHHVWAGSLNKDPTMRILEKMKEKGEIPKFYRIAWFLWLPLPAAAQHLLFWFYPLRVLKEGTNDQSFFRSSIISSVFLILCYGAFIYYFSFAWLLQNIGLAILLYFLLTEIINLPHHMNVPVFVSGERLSKLHPWQQHVTTRSCPYPGVLSEIITLNFSLHIEHHYFPSLPWYRLKGLRDIIKPLLVDEYKEVSDFGWNIEKRKFSPEKTILSDVKHPLLEP